jgi:MtrB/PioB family decaheme-associated outer membrane protein
MKRRMAIWALVGAGLGQSAAADDDIFGKTSPTAQYDSEVSAGVRWQSQSSPVFGRYNGLTDRGLAGFGDFTVRRRDDWQSGATRYFEATGGNLLFQGDNAAPEASVGVKLGQQGRWGVTATYDAISYAGNTINSLYDKSGNLAAGLPVWGGTPLDGPPTSLTAGFYNDQPSLLAQAMQHLTTGTRRDIVGGTGSYRWGAFSITAGLRHEHKDGSMEQTMFNPFITSTTFAQPIDYDTDRGELTLAYATKRLQAQFAYSYSRFTDNNLSFNLPYYFSNLIPPFQATSAFSLPPSNDAHTLAGMLGFTLTPTTRLNANFRYGLQAQNAPLAPATGSTPAQIGPSFQVLANNPASLSGLARVYGGTVSIVSRPFYKLDLKAAYMLDGRDVDTSSYAIWGAPRPESTFGAFPYSFSVPQSWLKQNASLEAGYRLLSASNTKLTLGYAFDKINRSVAQVGQSNESTISAKLSSAPLAGLKGLLAYDHAVRSATVNLLYPWQVLTGDPSAGFNSVAYYQAARVQDAVKARLDFTPGRVVTAGLFGRFTHNHYNYPSGVATSGLLPSSGVVRDYTLAFGPDVGYRPAPGLTTHAFYTYQEIYHNDHGIGVPLGWTATTKDHVHTTGLSADWQPTDRLKVVTSYTFSYGNITYYMFDGIVVANPTASYQNVQPLPHVPSTMHALDLHGEYQLAPNLSLWAGYSYNLFKDNDWAYSRWPAVTQIAPTGIVTVSGTATPSYRVHGIATGVKVRF